MTSCVNWRFQLRSARGAACRICEYNLAIDGRAYARDYISIDVEICGERGGKYLAGLSVAGVQLIGGLDQDDAARRERDHLRGLRRRRGHGSKRQRGD